MSTSYGVGVRDETENRTISAVMNHLEVDHSTIEAEYNMARMIAGSKYKR